MLLSATWDLQDRARNATDAIVSSMLTVDSSQVLLLKREISHTDETMQVSLDEKETETEKEHTAVDRLCQAHSPHGEVTTGVNGTDLFCVNVSFIKFFLCYNLYCNQVI